MEVWGWESSGLCLDAMNRRGGEPSIYLFFQ
jgi:hypothetical protein